jgi:hypothetical protein
MRGVCESVCDLHTRGEELKAIQREASFRARRWVVERTHSSLNRFRRLLLRREKQADTYLAMLHLACGLLTWRAAGLFAREERPSKLALKPVSDSCDAAVCA